MSALAWSAIIAAGGLVLSVIASLLFTGVAWGRVRADVDHLIATRPDMATKDQVTSLAKDVAEIKGMFRVTLRAEHGGKE